MKKAILEIPEEGIKYEFENVYIYSQKKILRIPSYTPLVAFDEVTADPPIYVIMSNAPEDLIEVISDVVNRYCNSY